MSTPALPSPPEDSRVGAAAPTSGRNAALVGTGILLSRLAGLARNMLQARFLGAGVAADAFVAATKIPNILQNLFGEGALSASFIPVYSRLRARGDIDAAQRLASAVAGLLAVVVTIAVAFGVIAAPLLVRALEWGFTGERYDMAVYLTRIMFPGTGVLVLSAWALGVLNSHRRFLLPYAAPVLWNLAIITALVWFGPRPQSTPNTLVEKLAWATVIGSVLQLLVQLPLALRLAGGLRASLGRENPDVQLVRRTFAPALISRGVLQISAYIDMGLATLLPHGLVAIQLYASTIYMLPVSLFGMSIAASELPELSDDAGESAAAVARIRVRLGLALERVAFFIVPSAVALIAFGDVIIGILLRGGRFGHAETNLTWAMLAGSAIGLLAATMGRLYSSTFFAFHDTTTPQRFAIVRVVIGAALGAFLGLLAPRLLGIDRSWGGAGLSLGGAIAGWIEFTLLRRHMDRRVGRTGVPKGRLPRLVLAAIGAAIVAIAARLYLPDLGRHVSGGIILMVFSAFYGAAAFSLRIPQAESLIAHAVKIVRRR